MRHKFDHSRKLILAPVLLLASVFGCAVSMEDCDPNLVNNPLQSMACGGNYTKRVELKRHELAQLVEETRLEEVRAAELTVQASAMSRDAGRLQSTLSDLQLEIDGARLRLTSAEITTQEARAENEVLLAELSALEAKVQNISNAELTSPELEAELKEIERKKQALREFSDVPVF